MKSNSSLFTSTDHEHSVNLAEGAAESTASDQAAEPASPPTDLAGDQATEPTELANDQATDLASPPTELASENLKSRFHLHFSQNVLNCNYLTFQISMSQHFWLDSWCVWLSCLNGTTRSWRPSHFLVFLFTVLSQMFSRISAG